MRLGRLAVPAAALAVVAAVCLLLFRSATDSPEPGGRAGDDAAAEQAPRGDDAADARHRAGKPVVPVDLPPLPADASVVLRLVDERGAPVGDGHVTAVRTDPPRGERWTYGMQPQAPEVGRAAPDASASADAGGRAVLRALQPGAWQAVATAPGRAMTVVRFARGADPVPLEMTVPMQRECVLVGRVLDPRGAPLADVTVAATVGGDDPDTPDPETRRECRTGAAGEWRLGNLPAGRARLWTWRDDQGWRRRGDVALPEVSRLDLVLPDGGAVTGVVRAVATGSPVAGARVEAWSDDWEPFSRFIAGGETDGDGRYRLSLREFRGSFELLRVRAAGFAEVSVRPGEHGHASADVGEVVEQDVDLLAESRVRGRVTGPAGPVDGALVLLWTPGTSAFGHFVARRTRTSDDGEYSFSGLPAAGAAVQVHADGLRQPGLDFAPTNPDSVESFPEPFRVALEEGRESVCDIALEVRDPPGTRLVVTGTVRTAGGDPVAGAKIDVWSLDPVWTLRDGTFRLEADVPATFSATIYAYAPSGGVARGEYVDVAKPETWRDIVLVVARGAVVRGRVQSAAGLPVAGARALLGWRAVGKGGGEFAAWDDEFGATVAADGSFEIPLAAARENFTSHLRGEPRGPSIVAVLASGHAWGFSEVFEISEPPVDVSADVTIDAGHVLRGRVVDAANRNPLEGATVAVSAGGLEDSGTGWPPSAPPDQRSWIAAATGPDGAFAVPHLRGGTWTVAVSALGFEPAWPETAVPSDDVLTIPLRRTGRIAGRVLDPDGRPVAGAAVLLFEPGAAEDVSAVRSCRSNSDGSFEFPDVATQRCRLDVAPPDDALALGAASVDDVVPGATALAVELPRALTIAGRVAAADGSAVPDVGIECLDEAARRRVGWTDTDDAGAFRIGHLRPGRYVLRFHGLVVEVPGVEAGVSDLVVRAAGSLTVSGRVVSSSGEPAPYETLTLRSPDAAADDSYRNRQLWCDEEGRFEFRHLAPGAYVLTLLRSDRDDVSVTVQAGASGLEVRLPPRSERSEEEEE